jgi:two-component system response regulator YesN
MYRRLQDNWYAAGLPGGDGGGAAESGMAGREVKGERAKNGDAGSDGRTSTATGGERDSTISGGARGSDVIGGSGGRVPGGEGVRSAAPLWLLEKDLTSAFAERRRMDLTRLAEKIWAWHRASRTPFLQVMEMAERLLRTFGEISKHTLGSPPPDAQASSFPSGAATAAKGTQAATLPPTVETPGTHQQLLAQFLMDAGEQLQHMEEAEGMVTDHPEINRVLTYIHAHYAENISLKALARHVAMEEHYLSRLFRQKTHETLINYLQQIRVKKAQQLLSETDLTVTDIGCRVGFPSDNYFIKTFKKWSGDTPGAYRRKRETGAE